LSTTQRREAGFIQVRTPRVLLVLPLLAVLTAAGCSSHGGHDLSMAQMRTHLDRVPLVAGLTLTSADEQPRQSSAAGSIVRHCSAPDSGRRGLSATPSLVCL
jgi:hypothetical protein